MTTELKLEQVLREEHERLGGTSTADLYDDLHKAHRSALSISGGGIRSATFALGVMRGLAKAKILPLFDYLSTVSGGGYIGSWLSSYARRSKNGIESVSDDLATPPTAKFQPEPPPVRHLRAYSNYLTPRIGLLSADTWALIGTYLRNLVLNWLILIPLLFAVLALPRLFFVAIQHERLHGAQWYALILFTTALAYLALGRPVELGREKSEGSAFRSNGGFLWMCLLPFTIAAVLMALLHAWGLLLIPTFYSRWLIGRVPFFQTNPGLASLLVMTVPASVVVAGVYVVRFWRAYKKRTNVRAGTSDLVYRLKKAGFELLMAALSAVLLSAVVYFALVQWFPDPQETLTRTTIAAWATYPAALPTPQAANFVCFGVPIILAALFLQATFFVGFTSWYNEEYDREWWARAGGWVLLTAVGWIIISAIVIYGPALLYLAPRIAAALGFGTGALSLLGGFSGKTAANKKQKEDESTAGKASNFGLGLMVPLFAICFLALLSLITSVVISEIKNFAPVADEATLELYARSTWERTSTPIPIPGPTPGVRTLKTGAYPALERDVLRAREHLWVLDQANKHTLWVIILGGFLISFISSYFIGVNRFSMHAMYRNRLIRAYLGASRTDRRPNAFTGFDPEDNLPMHRLRPETVWPMTIANIATLRARLTSPAPGSLAAYVVERLRPDTRKLFESGKDEDALRDALAEDLSRLIDHDDLAARKPAEKPAPALALANRKLLESELTAALVPVDSMKAGRPFHVVNMTLNLVAGKELAWQERKAETFTVSPFHAGNLRLGYRRSTEYGHTNGITLGTAVAISGAAASPNMGYHSSPTVAFLLTLFNVRLGWWLGNPGKHGEETYRNANPQPELRDMTFQPLIGEVLGMTDDEHPYIYLSDGGHFENLGLYEMVLRRVHCIVVSDAGSDENFAFEDLGNAIRKIRIDFGIGIDIERMGIFPRSAKEPENPKYCAVARIRYTDVDKGPNAKDGWLVYIKPAFYGASEPKDVYNYASGSPTFPHETTGDQFFSESQFESYRALGEYAVDEIFRGYTGEVDSVCDFIEAARRYVARQSPPPRPGSPTRSTRRPQAGA